MYIVELDDRRRRNNCQDDIHLSSSKSADGTKIVISSSIFSRVFIFPFRFISINRFLRSFSRSSPLGLAVRSFLGELLGLFNLENERGEFILCLGFESFLVVVFC